MKKHLLVTLLLLSAFFVACAHGKKTVRKKTSKSKTSASASSAGVRGLTAIAMRRGACFGRCPEYTITINSNGLVEYNGTRNTTPIGVYEKNIGAEKAQAMLKQFMDNRVDTCSAIYTARIADVPAISYTLTLNGQKRQIVNANFGPHYLVDLSDEMDELGKVDDSWKKISK